MNFRRRRSVHIHTQLMPNNLTQRDGLNHSYKRLGVNIGVYMTKAVRLYTTYIGCAIHQHHPKTCANINILKTCANISIILLKLFTEIPVFLEWRGGTTRVTEVPKCQTKKIKLLSLYKLVMTSSQIKKLNAYPEWNSLPSYDQFTTFPVMQFTD